MNRRMKRLLVTGLTVLGLGWVAQRAEAVAPTTDSIVVSVTPGNPTYAVVITSPDPGGYDFQSVTLGQTTDSTVGITVLSSGTVSEYFALSVVSDGGIDAWTPRTTDGATGYNLFELQGHFTNSQSSPPGDATIAANAANNVIGPTAPNGGGTLYNQNSTGKTQPGNNNYLWLRLKMPTTISAAGQRKLTLSINGQPT